MGLWGLLIMAGSGLMSISRMSVERTTVGSVEMVAVFQHSKHNSSVDCSAAERNYSSPHRVEKCRYTEPNPDTKPIHIPSIERPPVEREASNTS